MNSAKAFEKGSRTMHSAKFYIEAFGSVKAFGAALVN